MLGTETDANAAVQQPEELVPPVHLASILSADLDEMPKGELDGEPYCCTLTLYILGIDVELALTAFRAFPVLFCNLKAVCLAGQ